MSADVAQREALAVSMVMSFHLQDYFISILQAPAAEAEFVF
jgi:hypothetical protein